MTNTLRSNEYNHLKDNQRKKNPHLKINLLKLNAEVIMIHKCFSSIIENHRIESTMLSKSNK